MNNTLILYLLQLKLYFFKIFRYIKSKIVGISEVIYLDAKNNTHSMMIRFTLIKFLKYIQRLLQILINKIDQRIYKAQIIKNYPEGQKTIIVCPKIMNKEELKVCDLVEITNSMNESKDKRMGNTVYMKFEIQCPNNGSIDMKDYLIKYKDQDATYSHTLRNILIFNNKNVSDDAKINIKIFSSGKIINKTLEYNKVKNKHLIEFDSIDKIDYTNEIDDNSKNESD